MTDTVEAIVADICHSAKVDDYEPQQIAFLESVADRLQSAHDAEVGALRAEVAMLAESEGTLENAAAAMTDLKARAESAETRLREAERDARRYRVLRDDPYIDRCDLAALPDNEMDAALDAAIEAADRAMEREDG